MKTELEKLQRESGWAKFAKWMLGIIAVVGFGVSIYLGFFRKTAPQLEYEVLSVTDFFNNTERASYIKIYIDSLDVQESHLNISTYSVRVANKGNEDISFYDYDKGEFGLRIKDGTVLETPILLDASTDYIKGKFEISDSVVKTSFVEMPKMVLDIDDYFVVKIVVLHAVNTTPSFIPEGKISGQRNILVNPIQSKKQSFWKTVFCGNWSVQIVRGIVYFLISMMVIVMIAGSVSSISDSMDKRRRRKTLNSIPKKNSIIKIVEDEYINNGDYKICLLHDLYQKTEEDVSKQYEQSSKRINGRFSHQRPIEMYRYDSRDKFMYLLHEGYLIQKSDGKIGFNSSAKESVDIIYSYLKENRLLHQHSFRHEIEEDNA